MNSNDTTNPYFCDVCMNRMAKKEKKIVQLLV